MKFPALFIIVNQIVIFYFFSKNIKNKYHSLPEELLAEILLRLPVKSLGRFKCVCKSWCSIINSPYFTARHTYTTNLYLLLCPSIVRLGEIHRLSYDTLRVVEKTKYHPQIDLEFGKIDILSSCNGLILFSAFFQNKWGLWNPTTGQTKLLPFSSSDQITWCSFGFGFDTETMDYKVVMVYKQHNDTRLVTMYSLKTNTRTSIATFSDEGLELIYGWPGHFSNNGMISWIAMYNVDGKARDTILSIDLRSETIITTPCPSSITVLHHSPLVYKESLALVDVEGERGYDIWVLGKYGVEESWKKLFTVQHLRAIDRVLGFWKDAGKVFVEKYDLETDLLLLDIATQETTSLHISKKCNTLLTYRESLVSLNS
ncbi:F-box/kelch-repeat protein At3g23880-like [Ziziphus jujuba]|uniref:F-box/kelch-repeat protein At3g23880-like n=1 Tax=Ziziphus jujuba TaxID=326968 RepID=A0ABM3ZUF8_ZIZJJ|nr:F-box/kelch-repeat protein At3g23880-like [Ziziphus jujuba]